MADDWLIWQFADSAFPAGSFVHSGGLEAAWQNGRVTRGESLLGFIESTLTQIGRGSLPFVLAAHREPDRFVEYDQLYDAMLSNHVANRASRAQGQSLLAAAQRIYARPALTALHAMVRESGSPGHLAPLFGVIATKMNFDETQTSRLFLFCALRGLVSAAVRLGIVGPMEGQGLQAKLFAKAEQLGIDALDVRPQDAAQTAPILDLLQGTQDRLYSRLFQS
jgi:urease accessory protein